MKQRVLFVCIHNSARSQMAEALLNHYCGDLFKAESAGLEPGVINPLAIDVLKEVGIDISNKQPRGVFDLFVKGEIFSYVITVCDDASAERCPIFPGMAKRVHWSFPDPSQVTGPYLEQIGKVRAIRDQIGDQIKEWCEEVCGVCLEA